MKSMAVECPIWDETTRPIYSNLVVSDHGFSTIQRGPNVSEILRKAGFDSTKKFEDPQPGDVMVALLGGSVFLYVVGNIETVIRRLIEFLQASDFAGVIFSRIPVEGTFPLEQVRSESKAGPDVVVSKRWTADKNEHGTPGMLISEGGVKGKGHESIRHAQHVGRGWTGFQARLHR